VDSVYKLRKLFTRNTFRQDMVKLYLLLIPIIIGIIAGMFLAFYPESENDSKLLTTSKLIENGSPVILITF